MEEETKPPVPSLPTYITTKHFMDKREAAPLTKMLSKMLKPKFHRMMKSSLKMTKNKHKVRFY